MRIMWNSHPSVARGVDHLNLKDTPLKIVAELSVDSTPESQEFETYL